MKNTDYIYDTMPFGPDKGTPIKDVSTENLNRMLRSVIVCTRELGSAIKSELKRRNLLLRPSRLSIDLSVDGVQ